jgi:hypothetical protein
MEESDLTRIDHFAAPLAELLPTTYTLLRSANLIVHPLVSKIVLHGSRGLAGGHRSNSDVDLSLVVDVPKGQRTESLFNEITNTTLENWQAPIEVDLAVIYDLKECELKCFEQTTWHQNLCQLGGVDCFGLYKIQKGFHGFVTNAGIQVRLMYPCMKIWQRAE